MLLTARPHPRTLFPSLDFLDLVEAVFLRPLRGVALAHFPGKFPPAAFFLPRARRAEDAPTV